MIIETVKELREYLAGQRAAGKTVGLVPTMGFLHEGHLSLIREAKAENDVVVVSDFVNPTQFGPNEDFESYPRNIERDTELALSAGADVIFYPSVSEMYPPESSTYVEVEGNITRVLCGASRPTHFRGVTTVVNKLFNIVEPNKAYFGQKDAQQVAVLTKMVKDLHMDIELIICPIVREPDGLAMSSRNTYLSAEERKQAVILNQALKKAKNAFANGEKDVVKLTGIITDKINEMPLAVIDYVSILDFPSLKPIITIEKDALAAVAVKFGKTRLIDNEILGYS
ncbi:MAG TPA: pantoate--beta-alanine ligase [Paludibacteraceae bacterium]|nr:pantoate--beta-alanine ligase [Paludibacteraceae bacterium]